MTLKELGSGWFYNKKFILKKEFDWKLRLIKESGTLDRIYIKYLLAQSLCSEASGAKKPKAISVFFVASLFVFLACGITLAIALAIFEYALVALTRS